MTRILSSLSRPERWLVVFGVLAVLSGVLHVLVWLGAGMPSLVGPVTWRKPIVFGLSTGILALSLAWVLRHLPDDRAVRHQTGWFVGMMTVEVLLIDVQQWRGVSSHFNVATPLDARIFSLMGALIMGATGILAWWTLRLFRDPRPGRPREHLAAARAGMLLLGAGNLIGVFLAMWGSTVQGMTGVVPTTMGVAGNVKFTHAIGLHGLQVLPLIGYAVSTLPRASARHAAVRRASLGYALVLVWALWQAFAGRAPHTLATPSVFVLAVGVGLLAWPLLSAVGARLTVPRTGAVPEGRS